MIAAISMMRRRADIDLNRFRRHWLDVHGPLVCSFPGLLDYVQDHVIASPANNALARDMGIDGFPILRFANDEDRLLATNSQPMADCNIDSRLFVGAVTRVACEPEVIQPIPADVGRIRLLALLPGEAADEAALQRYVSAVRALPALRGLIAYHVQKQGRAPASTIPHLEVSVAGVVELAFGSLVDLECALATVGDLGAAHFVVEEHRLG